MNDADYGLGAVILAMTATAWLTRMGGFWLMSHVPFTPLIRKTLEALPGSVVAATVLPIVLRDGAPALLAVLAALGLMVVRRNELLALAGGLAAATLARAAGL
jgi:uncharacterized membrane protein